LATGGSGTGVGTDTIVYLTAAQVTDGGDDEIRNFRAGSGGDVIRLSSAIGAGSGIRDSDGDNYSGSTASATLSVAITGPTTLVADVNVIRLATAFANTAAMLGFMQTAITFASGIAGNTGNLVVLYNVNTADTTFLALVDASGTGATTLVSGNVSIIQTIAKFTGVSADAFTAANIVLGGG
jgi:hypothetical protein